MQVLIQLEFLKDPGRGSERHGISRIPSIGEFVCIGEESHEVHVVFHMLNALNNEVDAIVRVK